MNWEASVPWGVFLLLVVEILVSLVLGSFLPLDQWVEVV
jgi:hypothetical protein